MPVSEYSNVAEPVEELTSQGGCISVLPYRTVFAGLFIKLQTFLFYVVYTTDLGNRTAPSVPDDPCEQMSKGWRFCQGASWLESRPFLVVATLLILALLRDFRKRYRDALIAIEARRLPTVRLVLSIAGCLLVIILYSLVSASYATPKDIGSLPILGGGIFMIAGALIWLADPIQLTRILGWLVFLETSVLLAFPELSQPLSDCVWREDWLQATTFETAQWLIARMTGSAIEISRADNVICVGDFAARVDHPCEGL